MVLHMLWLSLIVVGIVGCDTCINRNSFLHFPSSQRSCLLPVAAALFFHQWKAELRLTTDDCIIDNSFSNHFDLPDIAVIKTKFVLLKVNY